MLDRLTRPMLRWIGRGLHRLRRRLAPRTAPGSGVHSVPVTPAGRIVLVRLRYADGWRLPGGGRSKTEDAEAAALRELREEIGMRRHGEVRRIADGLFLVRDVEYRPRWSLEVEEVAEFPPAGIPADLARPARLWLERVLPLL